MTYDFDTLISRKGSGDLMHEALLPRWKRDDLLPMWVADMNFPVCPAIIQALKARLDHPILGYTVEPKDYFPAIHDWVLAHHGWAIQREWVRFIPGIVKGIGIICNLFVKPDEKVIVMPPVYHPFHLTPQGNHREVVWNPLRKRSDGYYDIDFDNLAQVCDGKCRVLLLCNPHNPGGLVWKKKDSVLTVLNVGDNTSANLDLTGIDIDGKSIILSDLGNAVYTMQLETENGDNPKAYAFKDGKVFAKGKYCDNLASEEFGDISELDGTNVVGIDGLYTVFDADGKALGTLSNVQKEKDSLLLTAKNYYIVRHGNYAMIYDYSGNVLSQMLAGQGDE